MKYFFYIFHIAVVPLNDRPWGQKWERYTEIMQGYSLQNPYPTPGKVRRQMR